MDAEVTETVNADRGMLISGVLLLSVGSVLMFAGEHLDVCRLKSAFFRCRRTWKNIL